MITYLLFSESDIGIHKKKSNDEVVILFSLRFPPKVVSKKSSFGDVLLHFKNNLAKNDTYSKALATYESLVSSPDNHIKVLLGFDSDETGEAMAISLKENLIRDGVNRLDIIRMPLSENGYIVVRKHSKSEQYKKFLSLQEDLMKRLRRKKIKRSGGFAKIISLLTIIKHKNITLPFRHKGVVDTHGTSTATVITKILTGEG